MIQAFTFQLFFQFAIYVSAVLWVGSRTQITNDTWQNRFDTKIETGWLKIKQVMEQSRFVMDFYTHYNRVCFEFFKVTTPQKVTGSLSKRPGIIIDIKILASTSSLFALIIFKSCFKPAQIVCEYRFRHAPHISSKPFYPKGTISASE